MKTSMPGKYFIKISSILFIISAVMSILTYSISGLPFILVTKDMQEIMGWVFICVCALYTFFAGIQLIAGVKGIKGCERKDAALDLKKWGFIFIGISLLSGIINLIYCIFVKEGVPSAAVSIAVGLILPLLYIYGASLNAKAS